MLSIMLFIFLFFLGIFAMFCYFVKRVEQNAAILRDEHAQLRVLMRAMEAHLDHLDRLETLRAREGRTHSENEPENEDAERPETEAGNDPLLHLSFEAAPSTSLPKGPLDIDFNPAQEVKLGRGDA